jgi:hypothetical protein
VPKCIYCLHEDNAFDRDHVLPEAYGTFAPISFILYNAVCQPCNNYFGRTIERSLSRDSMEALLRFRYGTKAASEARDLPYRRLELKVGQPGHWFGATVVLEADATGKTVEPVPLPQVAFRWKGTDEWNYILDRQLDAGTVAQYVTPVPGALEIRVLGPSPAHHQRTIQKLKAFGINFLQQGSLKEPIADDGKILVEIAAAVDQMIFRAIAKIAFNYVAHQDGTEFVLHPDCDDVRNYIRYGTIPEWASLIPIVKPFPNPILFDDTRHFRQTNGLLITFDWNSRRTGFMAQVSLFNTITYHVAICPEYTGLWHDGFRTGHHFNIEGKSIEPLFSSSFLVRPYVLKPLLSVL